MKLELLLRREILKKQIDQLECLQNKDELKRIKGELLETEKEIKKQCEQDGHCFQNRWNCCEKKYNIGKIKIKKYIYERKCDICGAKQYTKMFDFEKK